MNWCLPFGGRGFLPPGSQSRILIQCCIMDFTSRLRAYAWYLKSGYSVLLSQRLHAILILNFLLSGTFFFAYVVSVQKDLRYLNWNEYFCTTHCNAHIIWAAIYLVEALGFLPSGSQSRILSYYGFYIPTSSICLIFTIGTQLCLSESKTPCYSYLMMPPRDHSRGLQTEAPIQIIGQY